jgi:hypothetical protein
MDANPTRKEEVRQMAQTYAEALIEEGRVEGELRTNRETLCRLLLLKFQVLPDAVLQRIEACRDVERLKRAFDCALNVKSLDDFDI